MGDRWGCDEKHQKVRGKEWYITAIMDLPTRFILAWDTTPTKEKYDAAPLLRRAQDMAGKIPRLFITDGLEQYHIAFKKVFRTLKGLRSIHIRDIHHPEPHLQHQQTGAAQRGVGGPLQVRPWYKQGESLKWKVNGGLEKKWRLEWKCRSENFVLCGVEMEVKWVEWKWRSKTYISSPSVSAP